jgi:hypothetical protein
LLIISIGRESKMSGPHTLIDRSIPLNKIVGKPTGQGFGAARKGPSVTGKPQDVVVNEDYEQGKSFKVEG